MYSSLHVVVTSAQINLLPRQLTRVTREEQVSLLRSLGLYLLREKVKALTLSLLFKVRKCSGCVPDSLIFHQIKH